MALVMKQADHKALDKYLDEILAAFKSGDMTREQAHADLAHSMCAAAYDDNFREYIRQNPRDKWAEFNT